MHLWQIGDEEWEAAVLIVDELVVNAVQHGRTDMTLLLTLNGATLPADERGRGVGIIESGRARSFCRRSGQASAAPGSAMASSYPVPRKKRN